MTILIPAPTGYGGVRHIAVSLPRIDCLVADQPGKYALPALPGRTSGRIICQRVAARAGPLMTAAATAGAASSASWPPFSASASHEMIEPYSDPDEAYEVVPMKPEPHGPPGDWWTVTRTGIPDRHFSASRKADAERYATDPAHRAAIRGEKKAHERGRT